MKFVYIKKGRGIHTHEWLTFPVSKASEFSYLYILEGIAFQKKRNLTDVKFRKHRNQFHYPYDRWLRMFWGKWNLPWPWSSAKACFKCHTDTNGNACCARNPWNLSTRACMFCLLCYTVLPTFWSDPCHLTDSYSQLSSAFFARYQIT